jgi:hypothetical protein
MAYTKKPVNSAAPSNNKEWTKDDLNILQSLAAKGASTVEIAKILGRTKASIWCRKSSMGLGGRLASSKGKGISAPTTVSTKVRGAKKKITIDPVKTETKKLVSPKANKPQPTAQPIAQPQTTVYANAVQGLADLKKLAEITGAKIVITLE